MDLRGRVSIIVGGAGHIAEAAAEAVAELGSSVVILDLEQASCEVRAQRVGEMFQVDAWPLAVDLADEPGLRAVPDQVLSRYGRIDILINCAALVGTTDLQGWAVPLAEQNSNTWRKALEVNLTAAFVLAQACREPLKASGHGSIIHFSSIYGMVGPDLRLYQDTSLGNPAAYAVSKGGLLQLTRWLATVLAPDVRVNAISPGGVWRSQPDAFVARYESRTPLLRMAVEQDLKGAVAFLASDLSAYVTGHNLVVDGGWTVW